MRCSAKQVKCTIQPLAVARRSIGTAGLIRTTIARISSDLEAVAPALRERLTERTSERRLDAMAREFRFGRKDASAPLTDRLCCVCLAGVSVRSPDSSVSANFRKIGRFASWDERSGGIYAGFPHLTSGVRTRVFAETV